MFALEFLKQYCPVTRWYSITATYFLTTFHHYTHMSIIDFYQVLLDKKIILLSKIFRNILNEYKIYILNEYKY